MGKLVSEQGSGVKAPKQSSAKTNIACGSGSRPTPSHYKIQTSAPTDPRGLGRRVPGALK
jgi:hypothetical protein